MRFDKYQVAHRHAYIVKGLSNRPHGSDELAVLIGQALKDAIVSLQPLGCSNDDARRLLVEAIHFELDANPATVTDIKCRATLAKALALLHPDRTRA